MNKNMNVLLEKMFIKRFCLPGNIDLDKYTNEKEISHSLSHMSNKNTKTNINTTMNCTCGNYHHVACTFYKVGSDFKKVSVLSYGMNKYVDTEGLSPSIHAEYDALIKLPHLDNKNKKKLCVVHLIVVRMSKTKKIQTSKPCANCIRHMREISSRRGYKIKHVYYSENDGIIKTNLANLEKEEYKHVSKFYRRTNTNNTEIQKQLGAGGGLNVQVVMYNKIDEKEKEKYNKKNEYINKLNKQERKMKKQVYVQEE